MSTFRFDTVDHFTAGAVGPPGQRTFFLQIAVGATQHTFKVEKQHVAGLAETLRSVLADLSPLLDMPSEAPALIEPLRPEWAVAGIGLAYDPSSDRIVVYLEEFADEEADADSAQFRITRAHAAAFADRAEREVAGGRPDCRWCGLPIDPEGHPCPKMN